MALIEFKNDMNQSFVDTALYRTNRKMMLYGGAGAGKSHFMAQRIIMQGLAFAMNWLVLRKWTPELKLSVIPLVRAWFEKWNIPYDYNKTDMVLKYGKSQVIFKGLDKHIKVKSAEEINAIWMEELTEFTKEDWVQMNLRMRGAQKVHPQLFGTFNPEDRFSWIAEEIDLNRCWSQQYTYKDNRFLDKEYVKELEDLINVDDNFYRVYTLGEWGEVKDLIFENYEVKEFEFKKEDSQFLCAGTDFGYKDPDVYLMGAFRENTLYLYDEIYRTGLLNDQFIKLVDEMHVRHRLQRWDPLCWADHRPEFIEEFNIAKFNMLPAIKDVDVKDQIDWIKRFKIVIHPRCVNTIGEIRVYKWREIRGVVVEEPVQVRNHAMDAMRYMFYGLLVHLGILRKTQAKPIFGGNTFAGEVNADY